MVTMRKIFSANFILLIILFFYSCSSQVLDLSFVGDIMAHDVNFKMKDYSVMYENVAQHLLVDDITFGNFESPVDNSLPYSTYPNFNVHSEYVEAAINAGIDVFSLANNHSNDQGSNGALATMDSMLKLRHKYQNESKRNIYFSGLRKTTFDGLDVQIIIKNNLRIAFVCVTEILNIYNASRHKVQFYYYNQDYRKEFSEKVSLIKMKTNCDLLILSVHIAEPEYVREISDLRKEYFRQLTECGADIIWAHHPHVVLPWEKYITKSGRESLIMYSMGNFISGQRYRMNYKKPDSPREYTGDSYILKVAVMRKWRSNDFVYKLNPIPITTKIDYSTGDVKLYEFTESFINDQEPKLKNYYKKRFNLMKEQLADLLPWEKLDNSDDALILEAN